MKTIRTYSVKSHKLLLLPILFLFFIIHKNQVYGQDVWYVNVQNTSTTPDGQSWQTAFTSIQEAIDTASAIHQGSEFKVWVTQGTYTGTGDEVVTLTQGAHLYGGFNGTETERGQRDWKQHPTVIDGENQCRGVRGSDFSTLDGFTIRHGYGNLSGGMYNNDASPTIENCTFINNVSRYSGGGMNNYKSSPTLQRCIFINNSTEDGGGGGIKNESSSPTITNCIFLDNESQYNGANIYNNSGSHPIITNCTIVNDNKNQLYSHNIHNSSSSPTITNSIIWGYGEMINNTNRSEPVVTYNCIFGGYTGEGNTSENPLFWDREGKNFLLHPSSPCIDTASPVNAPSQDIRSASRPHGDGIDMGAYEMYEKDSDNDGLYNEFEGLYSMTDPSNPDTDSDGLNDGDQWFQLKIVRVNASSTAQNPDGSTWDKAFPGIQSAIDWVSSHGGNGEVWVVDGTYTSEEEIAVFLTNDTHLYGGFSGTETSRNQRNTNSNKTIIDGMNRSQCVFSAGKVTIENFVFQNATSDIGAGISLLSSSSQISNCLFQNNSSRIANAIYSGKNSGTTIINCRFQNNSSNSGGCLFFDNNNISKLSNCTFNSNSATNGGVIFCYGSSIECDQCYFYENTASDYAGCISLRSQGPSIFTNCQFTSNTVTSGTAGVIKADFAELSFDNCTFENNQSSEDGGVMHLFRTNTGISNSTFTNNRAGNGGCIYNEESFLDISNCSFDQNHAVNGGVLYHYSYMEFAFIPPVSCSISKGNKQEISVYFSSKIDNCTFMNNMADNESGAIHTNIGIINMSIYFTASTTFYSSLTNCILYNNMAKKDSRLFKTEKQLGRASIDIISSLTNCTFAQNQTTNTKKHTMVQPYNKTNYTEKTYLTNCILWDDNLDLVNPDNLSNTFAKNCCIKGGFEGENIIDSSPRFKNIDKGDLSLRSTSPCIDTGTTNTTWPRTDILGTSRPQGNQIDMGAYEFIPINTPAGWLLK